MKYKDSCGEMQLLKMAVASQIKKEAQLWITSMLKVQYNPSITLYLEFIGMDLIIS